MEMGVVEKVGAEVQGVVVAAAEEEEVVAEEMVDDVRHPRSFGEERSGATLLEFGR